MLAIGGLLPTIAAALDENKIQEDQGNQIELIEIKDTKITENIVAKLPDQKLITIKEVPTSNLCVEVRSSAAGHFPQKGEVAFCGSCIACKKAGTPDYEIVCLLIIAEERDSPAFTKTNQEHLRRRQRCFEHCLSHFTPLLVYSLVTGIGTFFSLPLTIGTFIPNIPISFLAVSVAIGVIGTAIANVFGEFLYNNVELHRRRIEKANYAATQEVEKFYSKIADTMLGEYIVYLNIIKFSKNTIPELKDIKKGKKFAKFMNSKNATELDGYLQSANCKKTRISFENVGNIADKIDAIASKMRKYLGENTDTILKPLKNVCDLVKDETAHAALCNYIFSKQKDVKLLKIVHSHIGDNYLKETISTSFCEYNE